MAKCLLKSGRKLVVWNRSAAKCAALSADHPGAVTAVDSPSAVLAACDLVYCMLSTPDAVKAVYEMEGGVLAGVRAGTKLVDCATLAAEDMVRLEKQVTERGGRFLEAPVSGSKGPAASGQLIFLTAGDEPRRDGLLELRREGEGEGDDGKKTRRWMPSKHLARCGCTAIGFFVCERISSSSSFDKK